MSHSLTESGLGGPGTPVTSQRSPTTSSTSSTSARRLCSLPQGSFPSCPTAVPGPEESRAVAPRGCGTHGTDRGGRSPCSEKARSPGSAPAASRQSRGAGRRASEAGGGRRLGAGAGEGRRRGGRADRGWVKGALCGAVDPHPAPSTHPGPTPFFFPPPRGQDPRAGSLGSSGFWGRIQIGTCGELRPGAGLPQESACLGPSTLTSRRLQQPHSSRKRVGECWALNHNKPHLYPAS